MISLSQLDERSPIALGMLVLSPHGEGRVVETTTGGLWLRVRLDGRDRHDRWCVARHCCRVVRRRPWQVAESLVVLEHG